MENVSSVMENVSRPFNIYTDYMIKTDKLWELETLSYLKNDKYGIYRKNINKFHVVHGA